MAIIILDSSISKLIKRLFTQLCPTKIVYSCYNIMTNHL